MAYEEGIFVGYRHFDHHQLEPRFCFGHGLSYTDFEFGEVAVEEEEGGRITARIEVRNAGHRAGFEVLQLYVADPDSPVPRPPKELKGFAKVWLEPAQSAVVRLPLDERSFA